MSNKDIHVVPRDGRWAVRREGANRDSSHHDRKSDAMTPRATQRVATASRSSSTGGTAASRTATATAGTPSRRATRSTRRAAQS
jgi:hypothetical protein